MNIIELTELQFKNYAKIHSARNYFQTIEYANMEEKKGYKKLYLGFVDEFNNVTAATLILENVKNKIKSGYVPGGFLIDFNNTKLLEGFTIELKKYLTNLGFIYIRVNPKLVYKIFDKNDNIVYYNNNIINNMTKLGYIHLGFDDSFERYNVILNTEKTIDETFITFNRNTKRNIQKSTQMAISIHKGGPNNIELFYSLIRKKVNKDIDYYKDYLKYFNTENNKFELYFAKIDPDIYINNYRYLLKEEEINNDKLNDLMQNIKVKKTISLINRKMISDKRITKYKNEIIDAVNINKNYPNGLVLGTCAIIKNNREIYFLEDGYEEKLRDVYSSHLIKWEIIKKYMSLGYKVFNLGKIAPNRKKENNKYYGLYTSKMGFNGLIYEYTGEFDLVFNNLIYKIIIKFNDLKKTSKK